MIKQLTALLALFVTAWFLSLGHGSASALVVQQGTKNEFSDTSLGLMLSVFYLGFFAGHWFTRQLLPRVSYIRTFAVCAAAICCLVLVLPVFPFEITWLVSRFFYGCFFSAAVIIAEGWLNSEASRDNRSRIFGAYMTINFLGYGVSQYILLLGEKLPSAAFSLAAICAVLSLIPVCVTRLPEPQQPSAVDGQKALSLKDAYRIAPVAFIGQVGVGMITSASWLFVRYLDGLGFTAMEVAEMAVIFFSSGFVLQFFIGWLSDRASDRRNVIIWVSIVSCASSALLIFGGYFSWGILAFLSFLFGSVSVNLFSLNVAYGQDFVPRERAVEYGGRLFQSYALGAVAGPLAAGFLMDAFSPSWLFVFLTLVLAAVFLLTFTDRLMPRFKPVVTESHQTLSPMAGAQVEEPAYSELDIGPDLPDELREERGAETTDEVGPAIPDDELAAR